MTNLSADFFSVQVIFGFFLAMVRVQGFFLVAPIISRSGIPIIVKIGLSAVIVWVFSDAIFPNAPILNLQHPVNIVTYIFHEITIGIVLGIITDLFFNVISMVGQLCGVQMGQSTVSVFDPTSKASINPVSFIFTNVCVWTFITMGGLFHLAFVLKKSFEIMPMAAFSVNFNNLAGNYIIVFNEIFKLGIKFLLPIIALMFIVDVFGALFAKIMPQANMFILLMPAKIVMGAFLMMMIMPAYLQNISEFFSNRFYDLLDMVFLG